MRIGIVCPYSFDVPGGVQAHVVDLAWALRRLDHEVHVLAPADADTPVPDFVRRCGRTLSIPYNGSVARIAFGPVSFARVRRWIREHDFDVLHLHEPTAPSIAMLALMVADGPIVATFHTSMPRSRTLSVFQTVLQPFLDKITARIAVSALARWAQVEHLGGDAVEIPNGVDVGFFRDAEPLPGYPRAGGTVGFTGRYGESRKGMPVLLDALRSLELPDVRLLVVGRGIERDLRRAAGPELADRLDLLGQVDDETKARALRSVDTYCAPNTGGESFGTILTEAMSAGTPVVASDLDAFRRVLDDGRAGVLTPAGDARRLRESLRSVLTDPHRRASLARVGRQRAKAYDWPVVVAQVLRVYEQAVAACPRHVTEAGSGHNLPGIGSDTPQSRRVEACTAHVVAAEAYEWSVPMPPIRIVLLTAADQADLLAFEQTNREFFAKAVGDRGDAFFAEFPRRHRTLVDENDQGKSMLFVIRDALDEVVGRVNLADVDTGAPELGYRIAEAAGGRGYATEAVRLAIRAAATAGVRTVKAMATADNHASHQVLLANGFRRLDDGDPPHLDVDGRLLDAVHFEAQLVAPV